MTLDIPDEYERVLNRLVASGAFSSMESALKHALQLLADQHEASPTGNGPKPTQAMPKRIHIEDLASEQKVALFHASQAPPKDVWPGEEPVDDFLTFIREARKDASNRGASS